ncbi:MAG: tripartite tricarboxylate transporter substrate binding protein [Xanthobacteraceae bacterium]|nr:tripartite tricarboxylate transporter substrate binding protein [Xanthobacteraceae bacterium]
MLDRRACAVVAVVLASTPIFISPVAAEDWPTRPIRILVGFGAGGGTDVTSRIIGDALSEVLGQSIVVENKPGAGGTIAGDIVAKGAKDGYNALMVSVAHTVATATIKAQPYDAVNDFAPVGVVANSAFVVVVRKDFPADNLRDLIAIARREPGKLNYGSVTIGSTQHITAELLRQRSGIEAQHISFRTTPEVVTALMRGDVSFGVELAHAVRGQVQSGDLKIIAVMTAKRWPTLPDVPTVQESGISDFEVLGWYGLLFPAGVAPEIVAKTHAGLAKVLSRGSVHDQLEHIGALPSLSSPEEFRQLLASEVVKWRAVVKAAGLEPS